LLNIYGEHAYDLLQLSYNTRLCKKKGGGEKEEKHDSARGERRHESIISCIPKLFLRKWDALIVQFRYRNAERDQNSTTRIGIDEMSGQKCRWIDFEMWNALNDTNVTLAGEFSSRWNFCRCTPVYTWPGLPCRTCNTPALVQQTSKM